MAVCLFWMYFIAFMWSLASCSIGYSASECPDAFQQKCKCGMVEYQSLDLRYITNCTNAGFKHTTMLASMSIETEVLLFTGNMLFDLPVDIFDSKQFDNLEVIDFSNNHIQTIKGKTFHGVNSVKTLILDNNDMYIVSKDHHPRVFSNFLSLETLSLRNTYTERVNDYESYLFDIFIQSNLMGLKNLYLDNNEMKMLDNELFCQMKTLEIISLKGNSIQDLDFNITCLPFLKELDLSNNMIPYLSPQAIAELRKKPDLKLTLTSNPFDCSCRIKKSGTYAFLRHHRRNILDSNTFHCVSGDPDSVGKYLFDVRIPACPKVAPKVSHHSRAGVVVLSIILVLMSALLIGLAFMHRVTLMTWTSSIIARMRSQGRYSSLDRNEEEKEMEV